MTEPDEALLWAREDYAKQFRSRRSHVADSILSGFWDGEVEVRLPAHAYRAGATASADRIQELEARVAELEAALREVADDLEAEIKARAGNDLPRRVERDLEPVSRARALLKETDQ